MSLHPQAWSTAFVSSMTTAGLITVILPVMGFAAVMELTGCDRHLVRLITNPLATLGPFLVPGAMLATFVINVALPSAAGTAAAVGVVLIPVMIAAGINPAMAAAAVLAGTWGSMFSPGSPHPAVIAEIAKVSVMDVILAHRVASLTAAILVAVLLFLEARLFHRDRATKMHRLAPIAGGAVDHAPEPVNAVRAAIPMLPLALLLVTVPQFHLTTAWLPKGYGPRGHGDRRAGRHGRHVGLADQGRHRVLRWDGPSVRQRHGHHHRRGRLHRWARVRWADQGAHRSPHEGAVGGAHLRRPRSFRHGRPERLGGCLHPGVQPGRHTIHAARFGISPIDLGNLAWLGGALGRSMSPVAAATMVAAGFAKVNPFELAKRNAIPMLAAVTVIMLIQGR